MVLFVKICKSVPTTFVDETYYKDHYTHYKAQRNGKDLVLFNAYAIKCWIKHMCMKREHRVVKTGKRGLCIKDTVEVPTNVYHDKAANNREYMVAAGFLINVQKMC